MHLKIIILIFLLKFSFIGIATADYSPDDFNNWLLSFKEQAAKKGITKKTLDIVFKDVKYLKNVIKRVK